MALARAEIPIVPVLAARAAKSNHNRSMTISEAARLAHVGVETIRFYEREGLLEQPRKPHAGYRQYSSGHVERIRLLKQCQAFGFTLAEAGDLARSLDAGAATCEDTCELAERKLVELRRKIDEYQQLARRLEALVDSPCRRQNNTECTVVTALKGC